LRENNIDEEDAALSGGGSGDIVMEPEGGESAGPKNLQNLIFNLKKKAEAEQDIKVSVYPNKYVYLSLGFTLVIIMESHL
jgi:hypothetical protein